MVEVKVILVRVVNVVAVVRLVVEELVVLVLDVDELVVVSVSHFWFSALKYLPGLH
jgi:hypothetical protein